MYISSPPSPLSLRLYLSLPPAEARAIPPWSTKSRVLVGVGYGVERLEFGVGGEREEDVFFDLTFQCVAVGAGHHLPSTQDRIACFRTLTFNVARLNLALWCISRQLKQTIRCHLEGWWHLWEQLWESGDFALFLTHSSLGCLCVCVLGSPCTAHQRSAANRASHQFMVLHPPKMALSPQLSVGFHITS